MANYETELIEKWEATDFGLGPSYIRPISANELALRMAEDRLRSLNSTCAKRDKVFPKADQTDYLKFLKSKISTEKCRNPTLWESLKCKLFSRRSADHDKALVMLLNMSINSEFLLINAPPDILQLMLSSVGVYDTCERRRACEEHFKDSSVSNVYRMFFDITVNPVLVRQFMCSCVDILLLWTLHFNAHEEKCRIIMEQMASDDDVDVKVSISFLNVMEKRGVGIEDPNAKYRMKLPNHQALLFSHAGKKYELILAILKNLSANRFNRVILAQQKHIWRFCLLMTHCCWKNLRLLALDFLASIADCMYLKPALEEFALAGLFLVMKNGLKSHQTFVVRKSVHILRKWMWCYTPGPAGGGPTRNASMIIPFLDLPALVVRLGSTFFAPERDIVIDSLLILIILMQTRSPETVFIRNIMKSSADIIHSAALLIFARESDFTPNGSIILGLDSYLGTIINRINNTLSAETKDVHIQKLHSYRQVFSSLLKEVSANPQHRISLNELVMCGWAMRTYKAVRPPPLVVRKVVEEATRNELFRNKVYLRVETITTSGDPAAGSQSKKTIHTSGDPAADNHSKDDLNQKIKETSLSVTGRLVCDSGAILTDSFRSPFQSRIPSNGEIPSNDDIDDPPTKKFKTINSSCKQKPPHISSQRQASRQFLSYAVSNYAYPVYKQTPSEGTGLRPFDDLPKGYFLGSKFFKASTAVQYRRTVWNRILRFRGASCGQILGEPVWLPFSDIKRPAGPVCVPIVKLTAALLKLIADDSPMARSYMKGMEPQLAFLIACDEDYAECTNYLCCLFDSLR